MDVPVPSVSTGSSSDTMKGPMSASLDDLRRWLAALKPGEVDDRESFVEILSEAWGDITGSGAIQMGAWKLDRLEQPRGRVPRSGGK
jgi:hypothetical protein